MKKNLVINASDYCKGFTRRTEEVLPEGVKYYINENGIGTIVTGKLSTSFNAVTDDGRTFSVKVNNVSDIKTAEWVTTCYFCGCAKITA